MQTRYVRGVSLLGYGVSLQVGVGVPIPIVDEAALRYAAVRDEDIVAQVVDYSEAYPQGLGGSLAEVTYAELKSGVIVVERSTHCAFIQLSAGAGDCRNSETVDCQR